VVILQRTGDDLAGRGRTAVDQDRDGQPGGNVAGPCVIALRVVGAAAAGRYDLAAIEKGVGYGDRLIEQPAGVVAQVEHDTFDVLSLKVVCRFDNQARGVVGKSANADVADVASHHAVLDTRHLNALPGDGQVELPGAIADQTKLHDSAGFAANLGDRIVDTHAAGTFAIDGGDDILRL
jgi:hypothetical protein